MHDSLTCVFLLILDFLTRRFFGLQLRLVALNQPMSGDLGGISGADYQCYQQAYRARQPGVYRAFLSDKMQSIKSLVQSKYQALPVVNLKVIS